MAINIKYLAGFADGEGSIGISKFMNKWAGCINPSYTLRFSIVNTNKNILEQISKDYGGKVYLHSNGVNYPCYTWKSEGQIAYNILKKIYPYLLIKKEQCKLAIKFWNKRTKTISTKLGTPKEEIKLRERYYLKMKKLNGG